MSNLFNNRFPLVSVIVITYNSADYIVETLESIKSQTYANIEIIIADDCSVDETVEVSKKWLFDNIERFIGTKIVVSKKNLGVAGNCNSGLQQATGDWVKLIAGDDVLVCSAISSYMEYFASNSVAKVVLANLIFFGELNGNKNIDEKFGRLSVKQQLIYLLTYRGPAFGPSGMAQRETLLKIGGYDERVPMLEDYPMSLRFLTNDIKIHLLNKSLVKYRIRNGSISREENFSVNVWNMLNSIALPEMWRQKLFLLIWHHKIDLFIWKNRSSPLIKNKFIRYGIKLTDLIAWKLYFVRFLSKNSRKSTHSK
jgi:glycosyltransferase involved in cell wall biosynthesis